MDYQKTLNEHVNFCLNRILSALEKKPVAIYLSGGYGRGEGSWFLDKNNNPSPYNDYDFSIITDTPLDAKSYDCLRKDISNEIGISWIDIDFISPSKFSKLKATIKNVDLLYGSTFIYGDSSFAAKYELDAKRIGEYDILQLLKTRIWCFLGSWQGAFRSLGIEEARFFKNQMAKAILAACDMYLIKEKLYDSSYRKRVDSLCATFKENRELCEYATWALNEKLFPSSAPMSEEEMKELYFKAKNIFCNAIVFSLGRKGTLLCSPKFAKLYFCLYTKHIIRVIYHRLFKKSNQAEKVLDIFLSENYILHSVDEYGVKEEYIKKASALLYKWGYIDSMDKKFKDIHNIAANARNNI